MMGILTQTEGSYQKFWLCQQRAYHVINILTVAYLICQLIATEHGGGLSLLFVTHVYIFLWLNWLITELFSQRLLSLPACLHAAPLSNSEGDEGNG